jgi:hypothetical protein
VPHRSCQNHFLRDLAKPTLEKDSRAKVQMRKKVRGLRDIEREVLEQRRERAAGQDQDQTQVETKQEAASISAPVAAPPADPATDQGTCSVEAAGQVGVVVPCAAAEQEGTSQGDAETPASGEGAEQVVLDYCAAMRGILNDDQGGPLQPPGLCMAEALTEVRESLQRCLDADKPGPAHGQLEKLAGCIDSGLGSVKAEQEEVRRQVGEIARVWATLDQESGSRKERRADYEKLLREFAAKEDDFSAHLARMMSDWEPGLFLGPRAKKGEKGLRDNLELERWFRKPKRHERKIHGRRYAGVRIVQEGPTLVLVLDAPDAHPAPFSAEELLPFWPAEEPVEQQEALHRRKIMRQARSKKTKCPPQRLGDKV